MAPEGALLSHRPSFSLSHGTPFVSDDPATSRKYVFSLHPLLAPCFFLAPTPFLMPWTGTISLIDLPPLLFHSNSFSSPHDIFSSSYAPLPLLENESTDISRQSLPLQGRFDFSSPFFRFRPLFLDLTPLSPSVFYYLSLDPWVQRNRHIVGWV